MAIDNYAKEKGARQYLALFTYHVMSLKAQLTPIFIKLYFVDFRFDDFDLNKE